MAPRHGWTISAPITTSQRLRFMAAGSSGVASLTPPVMATSVGMQNPAGSLAARDDPEHLAGHAVGLVIEGSEVQAVVAQRKVIGDDVSGQEAAQVFPV